MVDDEELERRRLAREMPLAELRARVEVALRIVRELVALTDCFDGSDDERDASLQQYQALMEQMTELLPLVRLTPEERERYRREREERDPALVEKMFADYDRNPEKYEFDPEAAEMMARARDAYERAKLHEQLSIAVAGLQEHLHKRRAELQERIAAMVARMSKG